MVLNCSYGSYTVNHDIEEKCGINCNFRPQIFRTMLLCDPSENPESAS